MTEAITGLWAASKVGRIVQRTREPLGNPVTRREILFALKFNR
jgi:hypothetical protein